MFYLLKDGFYLTDFENPERAYFGDRFCDRCHFTTLDEAILVGRALFTQYGSLRLVEEGDQWLFSHLAHRFDQLYRQCFPVFGAIRSNYHQQFRFLLWEAPANGRIDLVYYHFSDRSISFFPSDEAQCFVAQKEGKIKPIWTGLNNVFIDPRLRTDIEDFSLHLWSILAQYTESLQRFERAQSLR